MVAGRILLGDPKRALAPRTHLGRAADVDGGGAREDDVPHGGAAEVVDGEADAGDAAVARRHVGAHAGEALGDEGGDAAVEHLEGLAAPGGDGEPPRQLRRRDLLDLEAQRVEHRVQLRSLVLVLAAAAAAAHLLLLLLLIIHGHGGSLARSASAARLGLSGLWWAMRSTEKNQGRVDRGGLVVGELLNTPPTMCCGGLKIDR